MANPLNNGKQIIDIIKYRWIWLSLTALLIIPGIIAMIYSMIIYPTHLPLKVGIDFTGGTILQYAANQKIENKDIEQLRINLIDAGIETPIIQLLKTNSISKEQDKIGDIISIRTQFIEGKDLQKEQIVKEVLKKEFPNSELIQVNSIGPTTGKELFKNSMFAVLLAFLGIVAYLTIRFQFDFAIVALISLMHDVIFLLGAFSILGLVANTHVDSLFVTAILTVVGFSVHDTIVVFDRIRENSKFLAKKATFSEIVNASVNQTLARSINTSLTTVIVLLALFFFGGVTTKDFVLAMILGITVGTYSSIFFASVLLAWHRERKA